MYELKNVVTGKTLVFEIDYQSKTVTTRQKGKKKSRTFSYQVKPWYIILRLIGLPIVSSVPFLIRSDKLGKEVDLTHLYDLDVEDERVMDDQIYVAIAQAIEEVRNKQ